MRLIAVVVVLSTTVARADIDPERLYVAPQPAPASAVAMEAAGGTLMGLAVVGVAASLTVGAKGLLDGLCGFDHPEMDCAAQDAHSRTERNAAIGVGVGAVVAMAVGVPLLVTGIRQAHASRHPVFLGAAPTGGGASFSIAGRF